MSREGRRLVGNSLHHAPVAGDDIDFSVQQTGLIQSGDRGEVACGGGHADCGSQSGSERTGCDLHSFGVSIFGMAGGQTAPLTEVLEILHRQAVFKEVKQTVQQHGAVSGGEDEAVASEPFRIFRIVPEKLVPQDERDISHTHRHARMPRFRLLDAVRGKQPHGIRRELERLQV